MTNEKQPVSFQFTEDMKGYVTFGAVSFKDGFEKGRDSRTSLMFRLTIEMDDIDEFVANKMHEAKATGYIECDRLGGKRPVERGIFNLFIDTGDLYGKKMRYRLFFSDSQGNPMTLSGSKDVQDSPGIDIWTDTSTLYTNLYSGHIQAEQEASTQIQAAGILRIEIQDFAKQLTTFRTNGSTFAERMVTMEKFGSLFVGSLWQVYGPSPMPGTRAFEREIPQYTTEGVSDAEITTHPFTTADKLGLSLLRFQRASSDDVVMIVHGLTTSSDMYIMPEHYNLVQYLLDHGFGDVWTLDCRMSNRHPYNLSRNRFNLDDIALYDYPAALAAIREQIGPHRRIHVIGHCLGSATFMMSLFGKVVTDVTSVIANSVALTPRIPRWSRFKLAVGPFLSDYLLGIEYMNPRWRRQQGLSVGKALSWAVSWFHKECDVPECHMLSFMWGSGKPALYNHENLMEITHRRSGDLYGGVSVNYYRHVNKMVNSRNTAVKYLQNDARYQTLPDNYMEHAQDIETPILFVTGQSNQVFTDSNIECHRQLEALVPGRHELHVFPNYGHQDVFMGKNVHRDVFPRLLGFLQKHTH
ncbi:MAG: alpha/beta hydrolase [Gammaproteobacteria bacterium]|nr:alpha/beta hydrolase [Gammaproteobacteria bacterium]